MVECSVGQQAELGLGIRGRRAREGGQGTHAGGVGPCRGRGAAHFTRRGRGQPWPGCRSHK